MLRTLKQHIENIYKSLVDWFCQFEFFSGGLCILTVHCDSLDSDAIEMILRELGPLHNKGHIVQLEIMTEETEYLMTGEDFLLEMALNQSTNQEELQELLLSVCKAQTPFLCKK